MPGATKFRSIRRRKRKAPVRSKKAKRVCASRKKLKKPKSMATSSTSSGSEVQTVTYTFSGSRLVELHSLDEFISERCICSNCKEGTLTLEEYFFKKEGFCTGLAVYCANCKMTSNIEYSRSPGKFLELNRKAVFAMRLLGQGRSALETFCAVLELPSPLAKLSFQSHVQPSMLLQWLLQRKVCTEQLKKCAQL